MSRLDIKDSLRRRIREVDASIYSEQEILSNAIIKNNGLYDNRFNSIKKTIAVLQNELKLLKDLDEFYNEFIK